MSDNRRAPAKPEINTPEAQQRAFDAEQVEKLKERKAATKVVNQWIEVVVRSSDETGKGKVILHKHVMPSGHTYSEFVGRESNPGVWAWLRNKIEKEGVKAYRGSREFGQPYAPAKSAPPEKKK